MGSTARRRHLVPATVARGLPIPWIGPSHVRTTGGLHRHQTECTCLGRGEGRGCQAGISVMDNRSASHRGAVARPPTTGAEPRLPFTGDVLAEPCRVAMSEALQASLKFAATLLDQRPDVVAGEPVIDLDFDGYHWTITRVLPDECLHSRLSPRELEIVRMVALGLTNRAIASALDISPWTVSTHLRRIFSKLDVTSRAAMVARAIEHGLHPGVNGVPPL
jgi:DNA-binding CsgD family transcriptional regulator